MYGIQMFQFWPELNVAAYLLTNLVKTRQCGGC